MTKRTLTAIFTLTLIATVAACGTAEDPDPRLGGSGAPGDDAEPCSVVENDDGSATISCPDGSSATVRPPAPQPGPQGEPGPPGPAGDPGEPGEGAKPTCDVLEGDLVIESSADVDTFALLGCRRVTGSVTISPRADLSSLDGLASLEEVDGDLQIPPCGDPNGTQACSRRLDIAGLDNLRRVGGALYLGRDVVEIPFWEITELGGLTLIGLDVANIDGFVHLTRIGAIGLQIREMSNIVNLAGLRSLTAVGGDVTIVDNLRLPQCVVDNELDEVVVAGTVTTSGNTGAGDCT